MTLIRLSGSDWKLRRTGGLLAWNARRLWGSWSRTSWAWAGTAQADGVKAYVLQQRPIVQGQDIPFDAATQNIKMSDDVLCTFTSEGGEVYTELRNTTAGNINVTGKLEWL